MITLACTVKDHSRCSAGWDINVERVRGVVLTYVEFAPMPFCNPPIGLCTCPCHWGDPHDGREGHDNPGPVDTQNP